MVSLVGINQPVVADAVGFAPTVAYNAVSQFTRTIPSTVADPTDCALEAEVEITSVEVGLSANTGTGPLGLRPPPTPNDTYAVAIQFTI
ncbi:MAG: hypothetical protein AAF562_06705 [Pseudomonadota bacterium]